MRDIILPGNQRPDVRAGEIIMEELHDFGQSNYLLMCDEDFMDKETRLRTRRLKKKEKYHR